jgi:hypothetical protein
MARLKHVVGVELGVTLWSGWGEDATMRGLS